MAQTINTLVNWGDGTSEYQDFAIKSEGGYLVIEIPEEYLPETQNGNVVWASDMHGVFDGVNYTVFPSSTTNYQITGTELSGTAYTTDKAFNEVTNISHAFANVTGSCSGGNWAMDAVTDASYAFFQSTGFSFEPNCGPAVTNANNMYAGSHVTGAPACGAAVVNAEYMYQGCTAITGDAACGAAVTNAEYMYNGCTLLAGNAVVGAAVKNALHMYDGAGVKGVAGTPVYSGTAVIDANHMFNGCSALIGVPVCGASVTNATNMYAGTKVNVAGATPAITSAPVGAAVVDANYMYYGVANLAADASCPASVVNASHMYDGTKVTNAIVGTGAKDVSWMYANVTTVTKPEITDTIVNGAGMYYGDTGIVSKVNGTTLKYRAKGATEDSTTKTVCTGSAQTDASNMYAGCSNLIGEYVVHNTVSNVAYMFKGCVNTTYNYIINNADITGAANITGFVSGLTPETGKWIDVWVGDWANHVAPASGEAYSDVAIAGAIHSAVDATSITGAAVAWDDTKLAMNYFFNTAQQIRVHFGPQPTATKLTFNPIPSLTEFITAFNTTPAIKIVKKES